MMRKNNLNKRKGEKRTNSTCNLEGKFLEND